MIALEAVSAYLPPTEVALADVRGWLGITDAELKIYRRFYGYDKMRWAPGVAVDELLLAAARGLSGLTGHRDRIRYVIQARTVQTVAPYAVNVPHDVGRRLGLAHAATFTVTDHACASGLLALDVAGALLAADGDPEARALILTGEKAFTPTIAFSPARTVMGEGTAACLVRLGGDRDRLLAYATATYGEYHNTMSLDAALTARFQQAYPALLAGVIREATDRAGLRLADLAMIVPHNSNRVSWVHTCRLLGFPLGQVFLDNIPVTGHCFCADPFVNYVCVTERGLLRRGEAYLLVSVGLGATFSAMVFRH